VDRLDQVFTRSKGEIEAHTDELGDIEPGRYFIVEAAQLLAAPAATRVIAGTTGGIVVGDRRPATGDRRPATGDRRAWRHLRASAP
jgi:hypothetical protein